MVGEVAQRLDVMMHDIVDLDFLILGVAMESPLSWRRDGLVVNVVLGST